MMTEGYEQADSINVWDGLRALTKQQHRPALGPIGRCDVGPMDVAIPVVDVEEPHCAAAAARGDHSQLNAALKSREIHLDGVRTMPWQNERCCRCAFSTGGVAASGASFMRLEVRSSVRPFRIQVRLSASASWSPDGAQSACRRRKWSHQAAGADAAEPRRIRIEQRAVWRLRFHDFVGSGSRLPPIPLQWR